MEDGLEEFPLQAEPTEEDSTKPKLRTVLNPSLWREPPPYPPLLRREPSLALSLLRPLPPILPTAKNVEALPDLYASQKSNETIIEKSLRDAAPMLPPQRRRAPPPIPNRVRAESVLMRDLNGNVVVRPPSQPRQPQYREIRPGVFREIIERPRHAQWPQGMLPAQNIVYAQPQYQQLHLVPRIYQQYPQQPPQYVQAPQMQWGGMYAGNGADHWQLQMQLLQQHAMAQQQAMHHYHQHLARQQQSHYYGGVPYPWGQYVGAPQYVAPRPTQATPTEGVLPLTIPTHGGDIRARVVNHANGEFDLTSTIPGYPIN